MIENIKENVIVTTNENVVESKPIKYTMKNPFLSNNNKNDNENDKNIANIISKYSFKKKY